MKKFPITLIPLAAVLVVVLLFVFYVPKDADLISANGDFILGEALSFLFLAALVADIYRFKK